MPTYEYVCTDCQNQWEEMQKISEDPLKDCPRCGKSTAKRQISGGNFILKGGGWYADLYSSTKPSGSSSSEPSGSASTSSESKSEKKPSAAPAASTPSAPSGSGSSGSSSSGSGST